MYFTLVIQCHIVSKENGQKQWHKLICVFRVHTKGGFVPGGSWTDTGK